MKQSFRNATSFYKNHWIIPSIKQNCCALSLIKSLCFPVNLISNKSHLLVLALRSTCLHSCSTTHSNGKSFYQQWALPSTPPSNQPLALLPFNYCMDLKRKQRNVKQKSCMTPSSMLQSEWRRSWKSFQNKMPLKH